MRLAYVGAGLLVVSALAVAAGVLPFSDVVTVAERVIPILAFVIAVTVVAEVAASAGVFDQAAGWLARAARGRVWVLWMLVLAMAVLATAFLSLDTTAVLLTPVVVAVARSNGLPPVPFAFATVWLANTASLVLPVSNLTNLLALHRLEFDSPMPFLGLLGASAAVAIVVSVILLTVVFRRSLHGRYRVSPPPRIADRVLLIGAGAIVVLLLPLLVSGIDPWIPAVSAALLLVVLALWRAPRLVRPSLIPWQLLVFACGLFLAVAFLERLGSAAVIAAATGSGDDLGSLWRMAGVGAAGANLVNNLPAYLAFESSADSPARLAALLIGANAGPLITPWASLATLLWHERLSAVGVEIRWSRFVLLGLAGAPLIVGLAVVPLALLA